MESNQGTSTDNNAPNTVRSIQLRTTIPLNEQFHAGHIEHANRDDETSIGTQSKENFASCPTKNRLQEDQASTPLLQTNNPSPNVCPQNPFNIPFQSKRPQQQDVARERQPATKKSVSKSVIRLHNSYKLIKYIQHETLTAWRGTLDKEYPPKDWVSVEPESAKCSNCSGLSRKCWTPAKMCNEGDRDDNRCLACTVDKQKCSFASKQKCRHRM